MTGDEPGSASTSGPNERSSADGLRRVELFGLDLVDADTLDPVVEVVLGHEPALAGGRLPIVVTPNVDIMVDLDERPGSVAAEVFRTATIALPDGMPIVAASRLLGRPLSARLPGSGLFELLWPRLAAEKRPLVVLCAAEAIAERLRSEHADARCIVPPMFDVADDAAFNAVLDDLEQAVAETGAQHVLLGLGHPKDATIAAALNARWEAAGTKVPLCLGLGGSFAMYAGLKRRAPDWIQRLGLEWFFRFAQEPRRLFHRYFVRDVAFVPIVWRERRRVRSSS